MYFIAFSFHGSFCEATPAVHILGVNHVWTSAKTASDWVTEFLLTLPCVCCSRWSAIPSADASSEPGLLFSCILLQLRYTFSDQVWIPNLRQLQLLWALDAWTRRKCSHSEAVGPAWTRWKFPLPWVSTPRDALSLRPIGRLRLIKLTLRRQPCEVSLQWGNRQGLLRPPSRVGWFCTCRGNKSLRRCETRREGNVQPLKAERKKRGSMRWQRWAAGEAFRTWVL